MAWTYTPEDIGTSRKDEVRFLTGDTDMTDPLIQNEEIEHVLTQFAPADGKPAYLAAAQVCSAIASKFGRRAQRSIGPLSIAAQQQYEHYVQLAESLRLLYDNGGRSATSVRVAAPILGGGGRTYLGGYDSVYDPSLDR